MKKFTLAMAAIGMVAGMTFTACQSGGQSKSSINDTIQSGVSDILEKHLKEYDAEVGKVIVVETATGKIRAMVALVKSDSVYKTDAHEFEYCHASGLAKGVSLLAILEKGKMTLDSRVETGNGVYVSKENGDTIYDSNWDRGGYGEMTLRDVFAKGSNVGMRKAAEYSFADNQEQVAQEKKIIDKGGAPNSFIGYSQGFETYHYLLDFYNAIANGGKMIATSNKEDSIVVAGHQMAKTENIDSMKSVLRHFITDGLGKKANSDKVQVAGACATMKMDDGSIYGDFIGYFPIDAPKYTVFVSLKRTSAPMSAGSMCAPIFKAIAEKLCQ